MPGVPEGLPSVERAVVYVSIGFDPHEDPEGLPSVERAIVSVSTGFDPHEHEDPEGLPSVFGALPHVERGAASAFAEIREEVATVAKMRFLRSSFRASRSSLVSF
jgi:hypothetical protein